MNDSSVEAVKAVVNGAVSIAALVLLCLGTWHTATGEVLCALVITSTGGTSVGSAIKSRNGNGH